MKKFLPILITCIFFITGCTKNYKTVDEYYDATQEVQKKWSSITIEHTVETNGKKTLLKAYKKGNKWKFEIKGLSGNAQYDKIEWFDGNNLFRQYPSGETFLFEFKDSDIASLLTRFDSICYSAYIMLDWKYDLPKNTSGDKAPVFVKTNERKNNFKCRLIKYDDKNEVCVNDKYGIAVYKKITRKDAFFKGSIYIVNVTKIDTSDIDDDIFKAPKEYNTYRI